MVLNYIRLKLFVGREQNEQNRVNKKEVSQG